MLSLTIPRPGGLEMLRPVEGPSPVPADGEALVRVEAAGVNYADAMVRMGLYDAAKGRYPIVPGFEFAGTVQALGRGASRFKAGEAVFGITRFGGYASELAVPEGRLWRVPAGWTAEQAATFPAVHLTAAYAFEEVARSRAGERVLVHSAAGGMGLALCQLGKALGLRSVGIVGSTAKAKLPLEFGAEAVVDKSAGDWTAEARRLAPDGYDAALDANGAETLRSSFELLAPGGRLLVYGFASMLARGKDRPDKLKLAYDYLRTPRWGPFELVSRNRAVMGFNVVHLFHKAALASDAMERLLSLVAQGKLRPEPVKSYPARDAAAAHRDLESGTTVGKLALRF